jgi:hypothetical protein
MNQGSPFRESDLTPPTPPAPKQELPDWYVLPILFLLLRPICLSVVLSAVVHRWMSGWVDELSWLWLVEVILLGGCLFLLSRAVRRRVPEWLRGWLQGRNGTPVMAALGFLLWHAFWLLGFIDPGGSHRLDVLQEATLYTATNPTLLLALALLTLTIHVPDLLFLHYFVVKPIWQREGRGG